MRYILLSVLPSPFKGENMTLGIETPNFETVKRNMEILMDRKTELAKFEEFPFPWPQNLLPIYPENTTAEQFEM